MACFENRKKYWCTQLLTLSTQAKIQKHLQNFPIPWKYYMFSISSYAHFCVLCLYEKIFYMNYVAPLLYFANKVNLEKSYKSAKCVCYHQICATKMEHVINPAPLTLCKELTLIVRFSISKAFSIYKLSWKRNDMVREATKKIGKNFCGLPERGWFVAYDWIFVQGVFLLVSKS